MVDNSIVDIVRMMQLKLNSPQATEQLGARLAERTRAGSVLYLRGDLGTGKTTLVRGFLRGLGYSGTVKSPSYTLLEPYELTDRLVLHCDLYRLTDAGELEFLGLRDFLDAQTTLLVEWPERARALLPPADLEISLAYSDTGRLCCVRATSAAGEAVLVEDLLN